MCASNYSQYSQTGIRQQGHLASNVSSGNGEQPLSSPYQTRAQIRPNSSLRRIHAEIFNHSMPN